MEKEKNQNPKNEVKNTKRELEEIDKYEEFFDDEETIKGIKAQFKNYRELRKRDIKDLKELIDKGKIPDNKKIIQKEALNQEEVEEFLDEAIKFLDTSRRNFLEKSDVLQPLKTKEEVKYNLKNEEKYKKI